MGVLLLPSTAAFLLPSSPLSLSLPPLLAAGRSSSRLQLQQGEPQQSSTPPSLSSEDAPLSPSNPPDRSSSFISSTAAARLERLPDDTTERIEVVRVPEYEEMLAWAVDMDAQVEERRIAGLGGRVAEPSATAVDLTKKKPLEEKEALKINKIVQMLSRRVETKRVFFPNEMEELREALRDVETLLRDDAEHLKKAQQDAAAHNQAGRAKSRFQKRREMMIEETGDFDPIYGSKEVRDQIYLYLWSLVKRDPRYLDAPSGGDGMEGGEEE